MELSIFEFEKHVTASIPEIQERCRIYGHTTPESILALQNPYDVKNLMPDIPGMYDFIEEANVSEITALLAEMCFDEEGNFCEWDEEEEIQDVEENNATPALLKKCMPADRDAEYKGGMVDAGYFDIPKYQRQIIDLTMSGCYITQRQDGAFFAYRPFGTVEGQAMKRLQKGEAAMLVKKGLLVEAKFQSNTLANQSKDDDFGPLLTDTLTEENSEELAQRAQAFEQEEERHMVYNILRTMVVAEIRDWVYDSVKDYICDAMKLFIRGNLMMNFDFTVKYSRSSETIRISPADPSLSFSPFIIIHTGMEEREFINWKIQSIDVSGGTTLFSNTDDEMTQKTIEAHKALIQVATDLADPDHDNIKEVETMLFKAMQPLNQFLSLRKELWVAYKDGKPVSELQAIAEEITNIKNNTVKSE